MKIIDARLRPPLKDYLKCNLYRDPKKTQRWSDNFLMKCSPAVYERDAELLYKEMDDAGVTLGVMTGRQSPDMGHVSNDDLMAIVTEQGDRFVGVAGLDGSNPMAAIAEIERTVVNGNLRAAGMEPGCGEIPMYVDDARLYPIYQYCMERGIPMFLMGGGGNGPDLSYSNPEHIDRVCRDFPNLTIVNMHGSFPWVTQVMFSCMCHPNMYLAPDMYLYNMPGTQDYITAANGFLKERFLFGSGYPYIPLKEAVDRFLEMPFKQEVLPYVLYKNMARVLGLDMD